MRFTNTLPTSALAAGLVLGLAAAVSPPAGETFLEAELSGTTEVPGPGDANGSGRIQLTVSADSGKLCYQATLEGLDHPRQAHVHQGSVGTSGPPVITLTSDIGANPSGCLTSEPAVLAELIERPSQFYLNIHSATHPGGAIRGQLALASGNATP